MANETRDKLFTRNYILVCLSAFLMSFSFFILVPTLPLYLKDTFGISQTLEGVVNAIGLEPCKLCTYCWNGKE